MIIKWLTGLIKGEKRRERAKVEIEELKKALLEDPKFRDEILRELEYRTGRRDLLKAGVLGLLGLTVGSMVGGEAGAVTRSVNSSSVNSSVAREIVSDYAVKIPKPCTCIVAQDGTGDYDVSPGEDASEVIQKAIDYAHKKGGGEVRIKEGLYLINSTIKFDKKGNANMNIVMSEGTILEPNECNKILDIRAYPFSGFENYVSNIIINGGWLGQTRNKDIKTYNALGILIGFCKDISLLNVNFVGLRRGALKLLTNWDTHIINCRFFECGVGCTPQVYIGQDPERRDNTNSCKFIGCRFESHRNFATHLEIAAPSRQNFFDTCKFHGDKNNIHPLIYIHGDNWNRNFFVNCSIEWNGGPLIKCTDSTSNPNIFEACLIQSWGYYSNDKPYVDLISLKRSEIKLVGCYLLGGLNGINAVADSNLKPSQVWIDACIFKYQTDAAIRAVDSDVYINGVTIRDVGKYGIVLKPHYHSMINGLYIIHSDLDGSSTPAIWIQGKGVKYLANVDIELVEVPFQFDAKPDILKNINAKGRLSERAGVAVIKSGTKSAIVKHGLILKPRKILVTAGGDIGSIWVSDATSTQFTINCSTAPDKDIEVYWYAEI